MDNNRTTSSSGLTSRCSYFAVMLFCITGLVQAADVIENRFGMQFVMIPAGTFTMGTVEVESARMEFPELKPDDVLDETPAHPVTITQPFYLGTTEVTQGAWFRVMENKPGPEAFWQVEDWQQRPMATSSWYMAARFVEELNKLDSDYRYRLPSEAQWEYAARAGSSGLRPMQVENLDEYAWFINNSADKPQLVATRKPNAFGVYDMFGNTWEWVDDWYGADSYAQAAAADPADPADPAGPAEGYAKVRRGGSYHCPVHLLRPGYRAANKPGVAYEVNGFRVIAEPR